MLPELPFEPLFALLSAAPAAAPLAASLLPAELWSLRGVADVP